MVDFDVVTGPSTVTPARAAEPARVAPDHPRPASRRASNEPQQHAAEPREPVR